MKEVSRVFAGNTAEQQATTIANDPYVRFVMAASLREGMFDTDLGRSGPERLNWLQEASRHAQEKYIVDSDEVIGLGVVGAIYAARVDIAEASGVRVRR